MWRTAGTMRSARSRAERTAWLAAAALCACAQGEPAALPERGEAVLALTQAPADVACLRVQAVGALRSVERRIDLAPGGNTVFPLSGLPTGQVLFLAHGYAAVCAELTPASAHTWYGVPVEASLAPGAPAAVTIDLHR